MADKLRPYRTVKNSALRHDAIIMLWLMIFSLQPYVMAKSACQIEVRQSSKPIDNYARFDFRGQHRKYLVHLPPGYDGVRPMPLVVCLHGGGGDLGFARRMTRLNEKADQEGFVVAYPNGSGRLGDHVLTWNAQECCGYAEAHRIDDIGFLKRFLGFLKDQYCVDRHRIYLVGFSLGAMMAYRLAAEMPEEFAAFAAVSGSMNGKEPVPALPVPALIIHGSADKHVPIGGGGGKLAKWGFDVHAQPLDYAVKFWVQADRCRPTPIVERQGIVEHLAYADGIDAAEVHLYTIHGYAHSWPGGSKAWLLADKPCPSFSATDKVWDFFARHTRADNACAKADSRGLVANGDMELSHKAAAAAASSN